MAFGMRKNERVDFQRGVDVFMMGIDGTWRRNCLMFDVSQTGARLCVENSIEGLELKEFFLLLSSTGLAYRRCRLIRVMAIKSASNFWLGRIRKRNVSWGGQKTRLFESPNPTNHPSATLCWIRSSNVMKEIRPVAD